MSDMIDILDAASELSRLVERVEAGEELLIVRDGRPVARLLPVSTRREPRMPGLWRGRIRLHPDFEVADPGLLDAFEA